MPQKTKTIYICENCGAEYSKWIGKCQFCKQWNTITQETILDSCKRILHSSAPSRPQLIQKIELKEEKRIDLKNREFNRVLGGGLVHGTIVLIGGEPGIGKSTLVLQTALGLKNSTILYVSGEESPQQIKLRAQRLNPDNKHCYILCETCLENIFESIKTIKPDIVIIDSIQTIYTSRIEAPQGSISQIRECASELQKQAKQSSVPVFLIGHITKTGNIAGPKLLEHIVDVVLQFEGDFHQIYRILRVTKNRFGSTSELGIFEMQENGLKEVPNPSELLISNINKKLSGSAIAASINGIRPLLIEIQALVSSAVYGMPQRSCTGFDQRRLNMLLAVLEKRANFKLGLKDVFLNIAGGIKVNDPAIDLAVVTAILSSEQDSPVNKNICFAGEIGLSGEVRAVNKITNRITEAEKLGFKQIIISSLNKKSISLQKFNINISFISNIFDLLKLLFYE